MVKKEWSAFGVRNCLCMCRKTGKTVSVAESSSDTMQTESCWWMSTHWEPGRHMRALLPVLALPRSPASTDCGSTSERCFPVFESTIVVLEQTEAQTAGVWSIRSRYLKKEMHYMTTSCIHPSDCSPSRWIQNGWHLRICVCLSHATTRQRCIAGFAPDTFARCTRLVSAPAVV